MTKIRKQKQKKKKKEYKPKYESFWLFKIEYGCFARPSCEIDRALIIERLRGSLTKKELRYLKGGDYGKRRKK